MGHALEFDRAFRAETLAHERSVVADPPVEPVGRPHAVHACRGRALPLGIVPFELGAADREHLGTRHGEHVRDRIRGLDEASCWGGQAEERGQRSKHRCADPREERKEWADGAMEDWLLSTIHIPRAIYP